MKQITIENNCVVLVRSEKKEEFRKNSIKNNDNISFENFFCTEKIKKEILGNDYTYNFDKEDIEKEKYNFENYNILELILSMSKIRSSQELTTIIFLDDSFQDKEIYKAKKYYMDNNIKFYIIDEEDTFFKMENNIIRDCHIDVIGDVHGLYDELVEMLSKKGYYIKNKTIMHPENRKVLFLGDLVDKGRKSIDVIQLVYNSVNFANHYAIIGNHENKILQFKKHFDKFEHINTASFASSETILELLKLKKDDFEKYIKFINDLPSYYIYKDFVFAHANIEHFSPNSTIRYKLMCGSGNDDSDKIYQKLYNKGLNKYTLIRGHNPQKETEENVFSLDFDQTSNGYLAMLPLDSFIEDSIKISNKESFEKNIIKEKINFSYEKYIEKFSLYKKLKSFEKDGLIHSQNDKRKSFSLYKHSPKINSLNYFHYNDDILKANGIVFDFAGNIIINPIKKTFDYYEINNENFENKKYIVRNKVFGQIINVSINPFTKNLIYSSSNFINDQKSEKFFKKIKDDDYKKIKSICENKNLTITFCNSYNKLAMINAKENKPNAIDFKESELDNLCNSIGSKIIYRPKWKYSNIEKVFDEVLENQSQYIGYVFRSLEKEEYLFNLNSLATDYFRFLNMITFSQEKFLFNNTKKYKDKNNIKFHNFIDFIKNKNYKLTNISEEERYNIINNYFNE